MNLSNRLTITGETTTGTKWTQAEEAQIYFNKEYPGIKYLPLTDQFEYRGFIFNYFRSGVRFFILGKTEPQNAKDDFDRISGGYTLVDPEDSQNWLFSFGDKEDRWKDFVKRVEDRKLEIARENQPDFNIHKNFIMAFVFAAILLVIFSAFCK